MNVRIPASPEAPQTPDADTARNPDYTGPVAGNRVLHISFSWLKYGTDDKGHAAALVLSVLLLSSAMLIGLMGVIIQFSGKEAPWITTILTWIGNAFLLTAGIAVGKGKAATKEKPED